MERDQLTEQIIGAAIEVHRHLGPGLMESTYEEALCIEFDIGGVPYSRQIGIPVAYKGHLIAEYRPDLVVAEQVVVEVKSLERLAPVHQAQLLTYMRALHVRVGLLINFNTDAVRNGLRRMVL